MSNKESVRLRKRKLATGNTSLYLDVYRNGVRQYEYLKLYLIPEKTRADKDTNRQTLQIAEAIKAKRTVELHNNEYGFKNERKHAYFFPFFDSLVEQDADGIKRSRGCESNWKSCQRLLFQYEKRNITFADITTEWANGLKRYIEKNIGSQNTKWLYLSKIRASMKEAVRRGLLQRDPFVAVGSFKRVESVREYLTIEEVRLLTQTPCEYDGIRRAFLFSCLTGLRISDVRGLKWGDVQQNSQFVRITYRQKKTKVLEYLDINAQAAEMMGERRAEDECVFDGIPVNQGTVNEVIKRWALRAGIRKTITFHSARHTFAIMMLAIGTDIFTVSKLLGHKELATTQIYAKILDESKQKAVANIPSIF